MMWYIASITLLFSLSFAPEKSKIIDSLKRELSQKETINRSYTDLVNEISFQYLLVDPSTVNPSMLPANIGKAYAKVKETENKLLQEQPQENLKSLKTKGVILTVIIFIIIILIVFLNKYFKSLQYSKLTSSNLDQLNKVILNKNKKIREINEQLDLQLLTTNRLLSESERLSKLGGWSYDLEKQEMYWTDEMYRQLQMDPKEVKPSLKVLKKRLSRPEFYKIQLALKNLIKEKKPQITDIFLKTVRFSRTLSIKMIPEFRDGKLVRVYGSNHDITEAIRTEKREVAILQTLFKLSQKASHKELSFKSFIRELLKEASNTLEIELVGFWLYNKTDKALYCYSKYSQHNDSFVSDTVLKEEDYPVYFKAMKTNRMITAHDAFSDDRTSEFASSYLLKNHIRSILDARVLLNGELLGVVCFEKTVTPITWSYSDQRFAGTISELISNAFSVRQNVQLEKEKEELIKKLLKRNQNLKEFAYVVSHNLRDPVTQILGLSSIYDKPAGKDLSKEIIPRIRNSASNLDKVIKDLTMVLRQQEESKEALQDIPLVEGLELAKSNVQAELDTVNPDIDLQFDKGFSLAIQPPVLFNILYNLLSNALKYRKEGTKLQIKLSARSTDTLDIITFEDNGKGIDLKRFGEKIFKMYERFHPDIDGNGLGLYLVKSQIENMGGSIIVESEPKKGTRFTINLPNNRSRQSKESGENIIEHIVS